MTVKTALRLSFMSIDRVYGSSQLVSSPPLPRAGERHNIHSTRVLWILGLSAAALIGCLYAESLRFLVGQWQSDDYSHGLFVPLISLFLIRQCRHRMVSAGMQASWWGPAVVFIGLLVYVIGDYATLYIVLHVSLWLVIVGLILSVIGPRAARTITFPLVYLLTSIPLPVFLYSALSGRLQLWSSAWGVGFLHLVGVTAFREGNVIDLGPVQLQVAEACSGIRYLFPLTTLALLCAYLFRDRLWKRILIVASALPISVLVNGLRIGIVGVLVEWYGAQAAEGFLHLFEGWILFMATLGLLLLEMWFLSTIHRRPYARTFGERFTWHDEADRHTERAAHPVSTSSLPHSSPALLCSVVLLMPFAALSWTIGERHDTPPSRAAFEDFSMDVGGWRGHPLAIEQQYLSTLRLDDYLLADYVSPDHHAVNVYVAYYRSQKKGQSAHSPQSCIPGGGWEIASHQTVDVPLSDDPSILYPTNRILIQKDRQKQVVLYWFKQRERVLSNEYLVKLYLFWDALTRGRSDGALIRLSAVVEPGETDATAHARLLDFARMIQPEWNAYVPD